MLNVDHRFPFPIFKWARLDIWPSTGRKRATDLREVVNASLHGAIGLQKSDLVMGRRPDASKGPVGRVGAADPDSWRTAALTRFAHASPRTSRRLSTP